jgi:hypothetical protein
MRADWNGKDLRLAVRAQLKFTADQAAVIRARLSNLVIATMCAGHSPLSAVRAESDCVATDR